MIQEHPTPESLSNEELRERIIRCAQTLSYHNAAEGAAWNEERAARAEANRRYEALQEEANRRGLCVEIPKDYLI